MVEHGGGPLANDTDKVNGHEERLSRQLSAKGRLTVAAMVRNVTILERLGSTAPADLENMTHGKAATVRKGPYAGEVVSASHHSPSDCAGTRKRDRQPGIDAAVSEQKEEGYYWRAAGGYGQGIPFGRIVVGRRT